MLNNMAFNYWLSIVVAPTFKHNDRHTLYRYSVIKDSAIMNLPFLYKSFFYRLNSGLSSVKPNLTTLEYVQIKYNYVSRWHIILLWYHMMCS